MGDERGGLPELLLLAGWHWNENGYELYDLLDRVSCKYCKNKNLKELRNIYHFMPDVWAELKELQDKVQMPFKGDKTIHDLEARFVSDDSQMSIEDFIGRTADDNI